MELVICILIVALILLWRKIANATKDFQHQEDSYLAQIDKLQKKILALQQECESSKSKLAKSTLELQKLNTQLTDIRRELEFYKNIEEDSGNLNDSTSRQHHQDLVEQAVQQIHSQHSPTHKNPFCPGDRLLLDAEQFFACNEMEHSSDNFFITGKAGTGKSFLLDVFRKTTNKSHIVLAPTGIAALNVSGATLHSTFGYYNLVQLDVDMISSSTIRLKSEKKLLLKNVSTIIIDEISMVRADTFDKIDRILRVINQNNAPFGGKQMLLFGDLFQLPPVARAIEHDYLLDRYGGIYFFCSTAYRKSNFRFIELTINHRQKEDAEFFSLLNRIRDGSATNADINMLNSRVAHDTSIYDRFTTLLPTKAEVERLNQHHIEQLNSTGFTYPAKVILDKKADKNHNLENIFPIADTLYLKKGALVMMVANDPEHRWVNGTLGIVSNLSSEEISVAINKQVYNVHPVDFTEQEITYENGTITYEDVFKVKQYPIIPAYAITIHKSQGQTYQNIVCDIDRCFASGQAYVALSRCASLNGLHLKQQISGASIRVDKTILDFYQQLKSNSAISPNTLPANNSD